MEKKILEKLKGQDRIEYMLAHQTKFMALDPLDRFKLFVILIAFMGANMMVTLNKFILAQHILNWGLAIYILILIVDLGIDKWASNKINNKFMDKI